jgi:hypothetical protein
VLAALTGRSFAVFDREPALESRATATHIA